MSHEKQTYRPDMPDRKRVPTSHGKTRAQRLRRTLLAGSALIASAVAVGEGVSSGGQAPTHVTAKAHEGHKAETSQKSAQINALSMPTVELIKNGQATVAPSNNNLYPSGTILFTSPEDLSASQTGDTNVFGTVPEGYDLKVQGEVVATNPKDALAVQPYQAVSLKFDGKIQLLWVRYDVGTIYTADNTNAEISDQSSYSQFVSFDGNEMFVDKYVGKTAEHSPIGVAELAKTQN